MSAIINPNAPTPTPTPSADIRLRLAVMALSVIQRMPPGTERDAVLARAIHSIAAAINDDNTAITALVLHRAFLAAELSVFQALADVRDPDHRRRMAEAYVTARQLQRITHGEAYRVNGAPTTPDYQIDFGAVPIPGAVAEHVEAERARADEWIAREAAQAKAAAEAPHPDGEVCEVPRVNVLVVGGQA
jgi:hypothetical protein